MRYKNLLYGLVFCILTAFPASSLARAGPQDQSNSPGRSASSDEQKQKDADKALYAKARGLLRQLIADSSNLTLPENRIRIEITAAGLIWPSDDKRGRELASGAGSDLAQLMSSGQLDPKDPSDGNIELSRLMQFRSELVLTAGQYDPDLALDLLNETEIPAQWVTPGSGQAQDQDRQLELNLANEIAQKNPRKAFEIAERDLKSGLSYELINLLMQLNQGNGSNYATKLAADLNTAIQGADLSSNQTAANLAVSLVSQAIQSDVATANAADAGSGDGSNNRLPLLQKSDIQSLIEKASSSLLGELDRDAPGTPEWNFARNLLTTLTTSAPNLQQYDPQAAVVISQKLAATAQIADPNSQMWMTLNQLSSTGTVDDIVAAAANAPASVRYNYYQQAMWKAVSQGDIDSARQIVNNYVTEPNQRENLLANLDQNAAMRDIQAGKVESALSLISQVQQSEQRAQMLIQLMQSQPVKEGDKKLAMRILSQARSLLPDRARNYEQLQLLTQLGAAFTPFDPKLGLSMMSQTAERLNSLIAAAQVMEGFDTQGNFKDGELLIQPRTQLTGMLQNYGQQLGEVAMKDFDSAAAASLLLDRADSRVFVELEIVQAVLNHENHLRASASAPNSTQLRRMVPLVPRVTSRN